MKINRYKCGLVGGLLVLATLQSACSQEDFTPVPDAGELRLELQLALPIVTGIDTRAASGTIPVNDVWVIQYIEGDPAGATDDEKKSKLIKKEYGASTIAWDAAKGRYVVSDTDATPVFLNKNSVFYVIANANTDAATQHAGLAALTEASTPVEVKALTKEIINTANEVTSATLAIDPQLLVAGPVDFEVKAGGNDNTTAILVAPLKRAYSRVTVNWKFEADVFANASFTATSLTVKNLPTQMAFAERAGQESGVYPLADGILNDEIALYEAIATPPPATNSVTFYMAENLRGIGASATASGKNLSANGPLQPGSTTRSLDHCTCITLTGTYRYDQSHAAGVGVKYIFYLGGNLSNDYNLRRGYDYTLNITVSGANSSDLRVSITDGNVVYFDEVTEIEPIDIAM